MASVGSSPRVLAALAVVAALASLAGCGSESDSADGTDTTTDTTADTSGPASTPTTGSTPTDSPSSPSDPTDTSAPDLPACDGVWQDGADLPRSYSGCVDQTGTVAVAGVSCSSGQFIVTYADRFWAVRGNRISSAAATLDQSADYQKVLYSCRA